MREKPLWFCPPVVKKVWSADHWRSPRSLWGSRRSKPFNNNTKMLFAFSIVCTFALLVQKKLVGKTAGTLTGVKRVAQNCANNHCIPHLHALSVFFKLLIEK